MRPRFRRWLGAGWVFVWLIVLFSAWWWQHRYLRSFEQRTEVFSAEQLQLPPELSGPGPIRLLHFWDPACPCNAGNLQHLAALLEHYKPLGVSFHALKRPGSQGQLPAALASIPELHLPATTLRLPASPAVAIWDPAGRLAYFGPYSAGAACNSANSFVEPVLEALLDGRPVMADGALAAGCFCDWNTTAPAVRSREPVDGAVSIDEHGINPSEMDRLPGKSGESVRE